MNQTASVRNSNSGKNGLLLLNKPCGVTSFGALSAVKKALNTGKVGHTGTLDKFASGLLLVLAGSALKLVPWCSAGDKEYEGIIRFGIETDTLDPEGHIIGEAGLPAREAVEAVLPQFRGDILQTPPAFSALHIDGKRAHELARQGAAPEMKKRPVAIYELEILSWTPPEAAIKVRCSAGTYIRSLARDIAIAVGSRGHLTALKRTRIAGFHLHDAVSCVPLERLAEDAAADTAAQDAQHTAIQAALKPIGADVLDALSIPHFAVDPETVQKIIHGKPLSQVFAGHAALDLPQIASSSSSSFGVFDSAGGLVAMLEQKDGRMAYGHVFAGGAHADC
jgi:tRNA pseudouridine55 synthase